MYIRFFSKLNMISVQDLWFSFHGGSRVYCNWWTDQACHGCDKIDVVGDKVIVLALGALFMRLCVVYCIALSIAVVQ